MARGRDPARPWLACYPPEVPADLEIPAVAVPRLLDDAARHRPGAPALRCRGTRITYRRLREAADRLAGALAGLGVGPMTRVAVVLPPCSQQVVALFATLRLGAVVVQCDPDGDLDDLATQLADSGTTVVFCLDRAAEGVVSACEQTLVRSVVVTSLADGMSSLARSRLRLSPLPGARARRRELLGQRSADPAVVGYRALVRSGTPARQSSVDPAQDIAVLRSVESGGVARLAMFSHRNLVAAAHQLSSWAAAERTGDTGELPAPLIAPPLSDLRATAEVLARVLRGECVNLTNLVLDHDDSAGTGAGQVPLPGTLARIVDPADPARELPVGQTGELAVKGPEVFIGYWRREADVSPPTVDGWWRTGQRAVMGPDGRFSVVGAVAPALEKPGAS
jgi:acyl-CoA synthetase (AMP-forming)/AMP-acid ligase II